MSRRWPAAPILAWGALLAAGALALDWIAYQRLVRSHASDLYLFLVAAAFLIVGLLVGAKVLAARPRGAFDGNPQALATLGISAREREVLDLLAAGLANKEIAERLGVSPHTVKTHVARLLEKLEAKRRTDAIARARALGILR
jgi:DNA-binding CsgD family transcriptional regulator